jgi:hypothetical protein
LVRFGYPVKLARSAYTYVQLLLIFYHFSDNLTQLLGVAAQADLKVDLPENYKHFEDNKKPEFLAKFPHGKLPAFEGADGFVLFEQFAVARYCEFFVLFAVDTNLPR